MEYQDKIDKIESMIGLKPIPNSISLEEVIDKINDVIDRQGFYCSFKGTLSSQARSFLSKYNFELRIDTFTAGRNSTSTNTITWNYKK